MIVMMLAFVTTALFDAATAAPAGGGAWEIAGHYGAFDPSDHVPARHRTERCFIDNNELRLQTRLTFWRGEPCLPTYASG